MESKGIHNPELHLAHDFVQYTGKNIFLTGKAGTGKTTFLHRLKEESPKRMIVVAPTGVAAINARGVTIHSFFQLPFGPQIPGFSASDPKGIRRFSREKRNIIKSLDLLVIDEISMVRADLLDGIDETLRRFRKSKSPFGGVQLLMIGDLQQLAPVVKEDEWRLLRQHYDTAFFFSSKALQKTPFVTIVLHHVYRQSDQKFIGLLNNIRDNKIDEEVRRQLNDRYIPDFDPGEEHYIILTTHNAKAQRVNDSKLDELKGPIYRYGAEINGNFPEYTYPTSVDLELKKDAQVMFVKNDPDAEKRYYNGKIGTVIELDNDEVLIQCVDEEEPISVSAIEWQNIKYSIDDESKEIKESVEGTFTQIPLKLAWAITIHKSQGLTFEKAIIDSEQAFAHGQVYVALSRCRTLEGLVLSSPFSPASIKNNSTIEVFNKDADENQPGKKELDESRMEYQKQLLYDLFDFEILQKNFYYFQKILSDNKSILDPSDNDRLKAVNIVLKDEIAKVAAGFRNQIGKYIESNNNIEQNKELQERIIKAARYFSEKINDRIIRLLDEFSLETDNKEVKKNITKNDEQLREELEFKLACLKACSKGFSVKEYLAEKARASLEKPAKKRASRKTKLPVSSDIRNADLYEHLREWRNAKAAELNVPVYMILSLKSMRALSNQLPASEQELKKVHGIGKKKLETYGGELLEMVLSFRGDEAINYEQPEVPEQEIKKPKIKTPKKSTQEISLELWREFKDVSKVASKRGMTINTILSHLAHYVGQGELEVIDFVEETKLKQILLYFIENEGTTLSAAKAALNEDITYADLKFVQAYLKFGV